MSACCASVVQVFWPLMMYLSPLRSALVLSEARSEPEPGSEKPWHHQSSTLAMRGRYCFFCCLVAEGVDDRADHADAEGERRRRRMHLQLFVEDVVLHRGPAGAAIFLRPVRDAPALLVQDAPPGDHLVLGEMTALHQLAAASPAARYP